eukprot:COSAG06_NODE_1946_length_8005_cov_5.434986_4_plen_51_part_00
MHSAVSVHRNPCQLVSKGQIVDSLHVLDAAPLALFALLQNTAVLSKLLSG